MKRGADEKENYEESPLEITDGSCGVVLDGGCGVGRDRMLEYGV
jgi:hypothetical protein